MELGLLNLMSPAGSLDDAGALASGATDADAFAKLIAQLGAAPATGEATPEMLTVNLAVAVARSQAATTSEATVATTEPSEGEGQEAAGESDGALDLASLGLPPLLAALVVPNGATPAAQPVEVTAKGVPADAGAPSVAQAVLLQTTDVAAKTPTVSPKAELAGDRHGTPTELPAPLAALVSITPQRGPSSTAAPIVTDESIISEAPVVVPDVAPSAALRVPLPVSVAQAVSTDASTPEPTQVAELMAERQLDLARGGEWLDQLAKDIARTAGNDGPLRFRLNPEHLGSLHVELSQGTAGASLRLTADTESARTIIADARPQLIAEARAQGVRITEAHVDLSSGGQSGSSGNSPRDGRAMPEQTYLTTWKPESAEERPTPPRRSASERYA